MSCKCKNIIDHVIKNSSKTKIFYFLWEEIFSPIFLMVSTIGLFYFLLPNLGNFCTSETLPRGSQRICTCKENDVLHEQTWKDDIIILNAHDLNRNYTDRYFFCPCVQLPVCTISSAVVFLSLEWIIPVCIEMSFDKTTTYSIELFS